MEALMIDCRQFYHDFADPVSVIMGCEDPKSDFQYVLAWQHVWNTGIWRHFQGHYGRQVHRLIDQGVISSDEDYEHKVIRVEWADSDDNLPQFIPAMTWELSEKEYAQELSDYLAFTYEAQVADFKFLPQFTEVNEGEYVLDHADISEILGYFKLPNGLVLLKIRDYLIGYKGSGLQVCSDDREYVAIDHTIVYLDTIPIMGEL
jgi:hypothetical protein